MAMQDPESEHVGPSGEQDLLGAFFRRSPSPMWVYDAETLRFLHVNQAAISRYGYTEEEFLSMTLLDIRPQEFAVKVREAVDAVERGLPDDADWLHLDRSGREMWVRIHSVPMPEIRPRARMAWIQETSDLLEARRREQEVLQRFALVSKATSDLIWDWDLADDTISWSDVLASQYGFTVHPERRNLAWWAGQIHPEDREAVVNSLRRAADSGENFWMEEYRFQDADGKSHRILDRGYFLRDESGTAYRMVGSMLNLSEIRRLELERDLYFQLTKDLVLIAGLDGNVIRMNPALTALVGEPADHGCTVTQYLSPTDVTHLAGILEQMRSGTPAEGFRLTLRSQTRERRVVEWSATPVLDHGFLVAVGRDVTDVLETRAGLERALAEAQELAIQAQAATRVQTEFLQNMSHELRTPMNGVLGMAQLLAETPLTTEQAGYVRVLSQSSELLLQVLNDILDFARIESGKVELEESEFDLNEVVQTVAELFAVSASRKGLALTVQSSVPSGSRAIGDAFRIRQILNNLVGNAVKFTHQGGVRLRLRPMSHEGDRCWVEIAVEDTGIGIRPEQLERVFERFTQADSSLSRSYGGTGLGLAIARGLAARMGGTLDAHSELGHGSVFTLKIPLRIPAGSVLAQPSPDRHAGKRVLVIEDQELNCMILQAWLEKQGFVVEAVADGDAARACLEARPYDLVLLDLQIPGLGSMDLMRWLRSRSETSRLPVVAVTASVGDEDRAACREAGMAGFVPKPVSVAKLDAEIQAALDPA